MPYFSEAFFGMSITYILSEPYYQMRLLKLFSVDRCISKEEQHHFSFNELREEEEPHRN